jgi:hypothetical protein
MTIKEASEKANMHYDSGKRYYNKYLKDPNHNIHIPQLQQSYTQEQKNEFIHYIISDKMSIKAASKKARMNLNGAKAYYLNYFKFQTPDIARPSHIGTHKHYTQEQIKEVIGYIVDDNMSVRAASKKVNITPYIAGRHYRQYLNDNNMVVPVPKNKRYTQDEINKLIGYIVDDKMNITAASNKANISNETGRKYYHQYLKDHNIDDPIRKRITKYQKIELIGYIVDEKMSIKVASKKANIPYATAHKYYHEYLNIQKRDTPTQCPRVAPASKNK